jgi:hypothetical protein
MSSKERFAYCNKLGSTLHALISGFLGVRGVMACSQLGETFLTSDLCLREGNGKMTAAVLFTVGYMFYDLGTMMTYWSKCDAFGFQVLFHHMVCILDLVGICLMNDPIWLVVGCANLITEFSTPFTSGRVLLTIHDMKETVLYKIVGTGFMLSFFVFRVIF